MRTLTLGYSDFDGPSNGISPFDDVFDTGLNLKYQDSLKNVDAIVLWGGADISPSLYNEERIFNSGPKEPSQRDMYEWHLIREAVLYDKPIIGVCRGAQLVCAFAGGKLVQHVSGHSVDHEIITHDGKRMRTSSSHHQMMYPYDVQHELLAWCEEPLSKNYLPENRVYCTNLEKKIDVEPEVVYFSDINAIAIQGHPEWMTRECPFNKWLMEEVVNCLFTLESC